MKFSLSAALVLLAAPAVNAFAPLSTPSVMNKGLQMNPDDNVEDRRTFGKVCLNHCVCLSLSIH
jgi:hypothetical protein